MSGEGSPSLLNLRDFRIVKKPGFSHNPITASSSEAEDKPVRRRIIAVSDSDSECEVVNGIDIENVAVHSGNVEIESAGTVSSETPQNDTPSGLANIRIEKVESLSESNTDIIKTEVKKSNGLINPYIKNMKHPSILEKEKQMKFLLEMFPSLDPMTIHNALSKHNFNSDAAAEDLSKTHGLPLKPGAYDEWKKTYDTKKADDKAKEIFNYQQQMKRKMSEEAAVSKKKTVKRRREEYDSDESGASGKEYKDNRVFDSDEDSDVEISNVLSGDKKKVLEFMETATMNELQLMNSCSKKKAEAILECRPFTGWIDLVQKLQENKNLSADLLNAAQQVLVTRNNIKLLMKKCTNLALQMEKAVAAGAGVKVQPRNLSSVLRLTNYQMVGLNWLVVLHNQGVNGILADEMGLGKTVQVISFLAYLKEIGAAKSTHLVIVPSSTLDNWRAEFARWCPELRVFMYYGSTEERRAFRIDWSKGMLADFDVILTTYTMVGNSAEERKMFRVTPMHYVIFDEAHMLKNMNTQRYGNLMRINAKNRICLTGTPLQNNLLELMSLLIFVMPKIFAEKADDLKSLFQKNSKTPKQDDNEDIPTFEKEQIEQAKRIMKPFVLRRLKRDVLQDLPKKFDHVLEVPLAPTQKEQYQQLVSSFQRVEKTDAIGYSGMSMMTDLRKLSNHPLLLRYHYDYEQLKEIAEKLARDPGYKDTVVQYIIDDLVYMSDFDIHRLSKDFKCLEGYALPDNLLTTSGKFIYLDKMLPKMKEEGHRVLIFSQYVIMLNIMEQYLTLRNYSYLRLDGSTAVNTRQQLIDKFTEDKSIFIFLLSTRAGGLGINLTAADTVIIHDIDFNPYNDKQAEDRCHRMGQTKPVTVYRFISQGTIEEAMLAMNREKLKLEREITTDETDNPDTKSVVRLLSTALEMDTSKVVTNFISPKKKS